MVNATWAKVNNAHKGYNVMGVTLTSPIILTVNYYDNYEFMGLNDIPLITNDNFKPETIAGFGVQYTGGYKSLLTGTWTALLDESKTGIHSVMYYDYQGRIIQTKSNNHLAGGIEKEYIAYNFTGNPTQKLHVHTANGKTTQTELYTYTYDHAGRLLTTKHKLNTGAEVLLAQNTYDELGRLSSTTANNQANLKTSYTYNIRSWTDSITNFHFVEDLSYNLNGNISTQKWTQANKTRTYGFKYDNLSRLESATYTGDGSFGTAYTYDKMGNLKTIQRNGLTAVSSHGVIDNLKLEYTGNQLLYITDSGPNVNLSTSADFKDYSKLTTAEYTFNTNGAMTKDLNKGISAITYNSLNLPRQMDIKSPVAEARNEYTYTATGTKLKVVKKWNPNYSTTPVIGTTINTSLLTLNETTDYIGNKIYENGILKRILTDNGYIEGNTYYFYIKDHLGNNRIVANSSASVIQSTQYYPFGMAFAEGTTTEQGKQPYKYGGKELDQSHGLNQYDVSARYYDPAYARFTTVDPLSEKFYNWSPYVYCYNNPMKFIDPDGKQGVLTAPRGVYRAYQVSKFLRYGTTATGVFAGGVLLTNEETRQRAAEVSNHLITAAGINAASDLTVTKEAVSPEYANQRKNDRSAQDRLDAVGAAVTKAIIDNVSGDMPSGDPSPKRSPNGKIGKFVLGVGAGAAGMKETVEYILKAIEKNNNSSDSNPNARQAVPENGKDNNSLKIDWGKTDWDKTFNSLEK